MNIFKPTSFILFIFIIVFPCNLVVSQSQISDCSNNADIETLNFLKSIKPQLTKFEKNYFQLKTGFNKSTIKTTNTIPLKFHVVQSSTGIGGVNETDLNAIISNLNYIFKDAFMTFLMCESINFITDDKLCFLKKGDEKNLTEKYNIPGVINIYLTNNLVDESNISLCGFSNNLGRNDYLILNKGCLSNTTTLAHEIGHFFSLIHTHGPDNDKKTTEFVDGSNCDTDGDGICDTPADPKLSSKNINNFCEYIGNETDAKGNKFKPDTKNIMSYSFKGCRSQFTEQQFARMYAYYFAVKNYLDCPSFSANFSADITQTCNEELTVNFEGTCKNISKWAWDINSDGIIDYTTKNITHTFKKGSYNVTLTVTNKSKSITKTINNYINVGTNTNWLYEDFDSFTMANQNGWTTKDTTKNGYNWLINSRNTPSENTGPLTDSSSKSGNGNYVYAEATGAKPGDIAEFVSPCILINHANSVIEFGYHMFGKNTGELHVDIITDNDIYFDVVLPMVGNQQKLQTDAFLTKEIDVSNYVNKTIKIKFRAIRGADWDGDIAIDNLQLKTIIEPISDAQFIAYPNPVKNNLLYVKTKSNTDVNYYQISNIDGHVILTGLLSQEPINVYKLKSGMYFLTVWNNESKITKKIIK